MAERSSAHEIFSPSKKTFLLCFDTITACLMLTLLHNWDTQHNSCIRDICSVCSAVEALEGSVMSESFHVAISSTFIYPDLTPIHNPNQSSFKLLIFTPCFANFKQDTNIHVKKIIRGISCCSSSCVFKIKLGFLITVCIQVMILIFCTILTIV